MVGPLQFLLKNGKKNIRVDTKFIVSRVSRNTGIFDMWLYVKISFDFLNPHFVKFFKLMDDVFPHSLI